MALTTEQLLEKQQNLEIEVAYQKDTIEALELNVAKQYQELQSQARQIQLLGQIINDLRKQVSDSGIRPISEEIPPPHY